MSLPVRVRDPYSHGDGLPPSTEQGSAAGPGLSHGGNPHLTPSSHPHKILSTYHLLSILKTFHYQMTPGDSKFEV